ncbi:hypothetical protein BKA64DRAFT_643402 [Cadophora sp. MPI-SDFR-AT-0126]|nr:hypothetical protein BKA64DRAFT_643402 [Leotiomycetes sp. MPI-SDFR-AT-0126]
MSERNQVSTFPERVVAWFWWLVVAIGIITPCKPAQPQSSKERPESEEDVLLDIINNQEGLRDRIALAQAREIVKDMYRQGQELRKKMKDMLAYIGIKSLQAAQKDCERVLRVGDYPTDTDENLQLKRQMILNLNAMGYGCTITDSWEVLYKHQMKVTERLIARTLAESRG